MFAAKAGDQVSAHLRAAVRARWIVLSGGSVDPVEQDFGQLQRYVYHRRADKLIRCEGVSFLHVGFSKRKKPAGQDAERAAGCKGAEMQKAPRGDLCSIGWQCSQSRYTNRPKSQEFCK